MSERTGAKKAEGRCGPKPRRVCWGQILEEKMSVKNNVSHIISPALRGGAMAMALDALAPRVMRIGDMLRQGRGLDQAKEE
jgi:hypothetical protein